MALLAQPGEGALDGAGGVQLPLGGPDVEVGAQAVEHPAVLGELARVALLAEGDQPLVLRQLEDAGDLRDHLLGELGDVVAAVAALGHLLAERAREQGAPNRSICTPRSLT